MNWVGGEGTGHTRGVSGWGPPGSRGQPAQEDAGTCQGTMQVSVLEGQPGRGICGTATSRRSGDPGGTAERDEPSEAKTGRFKP